MLQDLSVVILRELTMSAVLVRLVTQLIKIRPDYPYSRHSLHRADFRTIDIGILLCSRSKPCGFPPAVQDHSSAAKVGFAAKSELTGNTGQTIHGMAPQFMCQTWDRKAI